MKNINTHEEWADFRARTTWIVVSAFSLFYFCYVGLLASDRFFWIDEISTVLIANAPSIKEVLDAPKHVPDFQPAAFYLIVRLSRFLFGDGLIATRLPSMIGFYTFCVCLFIFVRNRAGLVAGTVSMLFPMVTGAFPYALEARPYGIQMGFAGLAVLFYQLQEERRSRLWLAAFSLALLGVLCVHAFGLCLAGVFLIVEFVSFWRYRRLRPGVLVAILLPVAIAVLSYLPIIADFRATTAHAHFAPGGSEITAGGAQATAEMTYATLLGPCLTLIVFSFFLVAAGAIVHRSSAGEEKQTLWPISELVLTVALLGAPIIAVCMAVIEKSQYFPRYASWAVAGFALLLGSVSGGRQSRSIVGLIIAALLSLLLLRNFATPLRKRLLQGEVLTSYTPADTLASYVKAGDPTGLHELLDNNLPDLPLLTPSVKDFVYIEYYSPVLRSRTHYVYASDLSYGRYYVDSFRSYFAAPFTEPLKTTDVTKLSRFLFYGSMKEDVPDLLGVLAAGVRTLSYKVSPDGSHFLLEVESPIARSAQRE